MPKTIMTADDIRRTLARIAHEIIEHNKTTEDLVIIGMYTRGAPLARRLASQIASLEKTGVTVGDLDIRLYRDDIDYLSPEKSLTHQTNIPVKIDGKSVVLVDDVLYTGRSIRAAMDALIDLGRPRSIQLVVFVDRGHREMPIRADYIGKNIPSSRDEEVQVRLVETDGVDEVVITRAQNRENNNGKKRDGNGADK